MKISKALLLLLSLVNLVSCKPDTKTSQLKVTIGPKPAYLLPVAIDSCSNKGTTPDLAAPSFSFTTFNFQWNGTNDMKIAFIQIDFKNGSLVGGEAHCFIAGDELSAALGSYAAGLVAGDTEVHKSTCGLRCGGQVKVQSSVSSVYLTGTAKIVGTEVDADGNATPVVTEAEVALQYNKL